MKNPIGRPLTVLLAAAVTVAAPGLSPYAAAQQVLGSVPAAGTGALGTAGAAGSIRAGGPTGTSTVMALSSPLSAFTGVGAAPQAHAPAAAPAAALSTLAAPADPVRTLPGARPAAPILRPALAPNAAVPEGAAAPTSAPDRSPSLMERLAAVAPAPAPASLLERLAKVRVPGAIDFDGARSHRGDGASPVTAADAAPKTAALAPAATVRAPAAGDGARYYVYETTRDNEIGAAGHVGHYSLKMFFIGSKAVALALSSYMVAGVYLALVFLIPVKSAFFLNIQTKTDHTVLRSWLAKRAPLFGSRREVFTPSEELSLIPGILKTIDTSVRRDRSYGFLWGFFGAFKTRRVEEHRVLVMADRGLPAEIVAQDGGRLGRMREVSGDADLVFRVHARHGDAAASWRTTVAQLFSGDVIDAASARRLRADLDEDWLRTAVVGLLRLAATTAAILFGLDLGLGLVGVGAKHAFEFAEIAALTYFIMIGVYNHSNGSLVYERYFGAGRAPAPFWTRLKGFVVDAWKESVADHENAVTVAQASDAGEVPLGAIARGMGAQALAGNGLRRQLVKLSPWLFGTAALAAAALALFPPAGLAALLAAAPVSALTVAGVLGGASAVMAVAAPRLAGREPSGTLPVLTHRAASPLWTTLTLAGLLLGGSGIAAAAAGMYAAAVTLASVLIAVAIVLDPFSTSAKVYDTRVRGRGVPVASLAFLAASLAVGAALLMGQPAAAFATGEMLVAILAAFLITVGDGVRHFIDPGVDMLKTPRSTPALAGR